MSDPVAADEAGAPGCCAMNETATSLNADIAALLFPPCPPPAASYRRCFCFPSAVVRRVHARHGPTHALCWHLIVWACWDCSPWVPVFDETQQAYYYHNTVTDETSWMLPAAVATSTTSASLPSDNDTAATTSTPAPSSADKDAYPATDAVGIDAASDVAAVSELAGNTPATATSKSKSKAKKSSKQRASPPRTATPSSPPHSSTQAIEAPVVTPVSSPTTVEDLRPSTLVWWSDAGDVWNGEALSGLLAGFGPRRYRNLGGGYYMTTLDMGPMWAEAAAATLGQGVEPAAAARVDWVPCTASAPGYGLFLRWAGDDDEQKLFDVPEEFFDDPPPDPAIAAAEQAAAVAQAAAEASAATAALEAAEAADLAEAEAEAAAAVAATEQAEAAGTSAAAAITAAAAVAAEGTSEKEPSENVLSAAATSVPKKRKSSKGSGTTSAGGFSKGGSIGKKRKGAASLIDKWKAVASTAGEEAEKEAEKQEKMDRWKARAAAQDPNNPNFMPLGRRKHM